MINQKESKNVVYGIVGMVALFIVGGIIGFIINGSDRINRSNMSKNQCETISSQIISAAKNNQPDLVAQLNKVYSENCLDREFNEPKEQVVKKEPKKLPETTCEAIEALLTEDLYNENNSDSQKHYYNADVYKKLATKGCESNREKYKQLSDREMEIAEALDEDVMSLEEKVQGVRTCEKIQSVLEEKLICSKRGYDVMSYECNDPEAHIQDAQVYANLSERGCPENSTKYKDLAAQQLEIARALTDDKIDEYRGEEETTKIVETYKRLHMKAEAEKIIEKAKKLTNPAIDFIIQLEKIIEE